MRGLGGRPTFPSVDDMVDIAIECLTRFEAVEEMIVVDLVE
jgi:hypothetical protein